MCWEYICSVINVGLFTGLCIFITNIIINMLLLLLEVVVALLFLLILILFCVLLLFLLFILCIDYYCISLYSLLHSPTSPLDL